MLKNKTVTESLAIAHVISFLQEPICESKKSLILDKGFYFRQDLLSWWKEKISVCCGYGLVFLYGLLLSEPGREVTNTPCSTKDTPKPICQPWNRMASALKSQGLYKGASPLCSPTCFLTLSWQLKQICPYLRSKIRLRDIHINIYIAVRFLTLTDKSSIIRMFWGLISLWTIFFSWSILSP